MLRALARGLALVAVAATAAGCYYDGRYYDETEIIRFQNHTRLLIDCAMDDEYIGTVPRRGQLELEGNFEGFRIFECASVDDDFHWEPREIRIRNGDLIVLDLYADGRTSVKQLAKPGK
jgi:hypothetical protein